MKQLFRIASFFYIIKQIYIHIYRTTLRFFFIEECLREDVCSRNGECIDVDQPPYYECSCTGPYAGKDCDESWLN